MVSYGFLMVSHGFLMDFHGFPTSLDLHRLDFGCGPTFQAAVAFAAALLAAEPMAANRGCWCWFSPAKPVAANGWLSMVVDQGEPR